MKKDFEYLDSKKVLKELKSSLNGLSEKEAKSRIKTYGLNELPKEKEKSVFQIFLSAINDPIIYVLVVAAILSFIVGEYLDGFAIIFIIMVDAVVSTVQEIKAEKNSEALKDLIKVKVKVVRENKHYEIDSSYLVPGDIIIVEPGTKVSSDARIINSNNLTVDESVLTGESIGVAKSSDSSSLGDDSKKCMIYAGTSVLTGRAIAVVTATGIDTEVGKIAEKVTSTEESKSPLTIRMEKFSKQITLMIIGISILIGCVLIYKQYHFMDIFLAVVALAVSAMPEGLPLSLTLALTIGSNKMAKRNVIVKKLNSVESLGSCTVIASDKTGTLTVNEQTAKKIVMSNGEAFEIDGNGYNDVGKVIPVGDSNIANAKYIATLGVVNNESMLEKVKGKWDKFGDSIDIAFLALGRKLGIKSSEFKKVSDIPYESENKYSAVFYKIDNDVLCTAKGSVEVILDFCKYSYEDGERVKLDRERILKQNEELASNGYRVIAICDGDVPLKEKYSEKDVKNLTFIGLVGFIDPVRKEAVGAIKKCKTAGIKVLMITGDHALTAYAIAKDLNIVSSKEEVVTGSDLDFYSDSDEKFDRFVEGKKVFARVTPLQKLKIVESLQRQGEFVAVTGDGVNDAPAIKAANIGVAMGSGTDVAKETAKMIIIDDNFSSIVAGIEEGRNAYSNIRKISLMLLSCGLAEVLFFVLSIAFDLPMPLVAIQLLWLNLVTDGLQDMALSFERETDTIMKEKPRSTKESLFEKELVKQIFLSGTFIGVLVFVVWYILINNLHMEVAHARGYVLALMVFIQNMHVLNCRSESKSVFENGFKQNKFVLFTIVGTIILQMIVMEVPLLSRFLQTYDVPNLHLVILFVVSLPIILIMEMYKYVKKHKNN
ncbi:MAG: HAD-IC family P-type ATPase [Mollicutes bacterium]|nr:HAD-IC family P-type ATPase [Mollicutes bacterium]